ncbi:MAG: hypothetical protein M0R70_08940 [Nitrospirae bacterium]|nr:hypothetical protein [Nitrospirota bacterium]
MIKRGNELMNKIAKTPLRGKWLILIASIVLCVGMVTTQALAAVQTSYNNNFTMISAGGLAITGGMNDVIFKWDGTQRHSVATGSQVSNCAFSSTTRFYGATWATHDVVLYGPGTYTVYSLCPGGSPGCGLTDATHPPITFTVGADELGVHYQFNWTVSTDIDMINIFTRHAAFLPSPMCSNYPSSSTEQTVGCGGSASCETAQQPADHPCPDPDTQRTKVWDLMSRDVDGDGINGLPFVDGPFVGFSGNMSIMVPFAGGVPPHVWPDTDFIRFGGSSGDKTLTIKNNGDTNLIITSVNELSPPFKIVEGTDTCSGASLGTSVGSASPPSCTMTIRFDKPENSTLSDWTTSLIINSNDAGSPGSITRIMLNGGNDPPTAPVLVSPGNGLSDVGPEQEFRWMKSTDQNGDTLSYQVYMCQDAALSLNCITSTVASRTNGKGVFYAGGAGLFMIGMTFIGGFTKRKRTIFLLLIAVLFTSGALISCHSKDVSETAAPAPADQMSYFAAGLNAGTTYYWKVVADDGKSTNNLADSTETWSFTTK